MKHKRYKSWTADHYEIRYNCSYEKSHLSKKVGKIFCSLCHSDAFATTTLRCLYHDWVTNSFCRLDKSSEINIHSLNTPSIYTANISC